MARTRGTCKNVKLINCVFLPESGQVDKENMKSSICCLKITVSMERVRFILGQVLLCCQINLHQTRNLNWQKQERVERKN